MINLIQTATFTLAICLVFGGGAKADPSTESESDTSPPQIFSNFGYKIHEVATVQKHEAGDDSDSDPFVLSRTLPQIISPHTHTAAQFNNAIDSFTNQWWKELGGPSNNEVKSDPDMDFTLDCELVGLQPPVDGYDFSPDEQMLPKVISAACMLYQSPHGGAHGGGENKGFNWLLSENRAVKPSDVFKMTSPWLAAVTAAAGKLRGPGNDGLSKLDFSDPSHWVLENEGLGLTYSMSDFSGYEDGGMGTFALIPWSSLAPYLRKNGIVPVQFW